MTARSFEETMAAIEDVDGWLSADQAARLYRRAVVVRPGERIVEIGSFRGRSTIVLASAAPLGVEVVAIDPQAGNDRGPREIAGFAAEAADDHRVFLGNLATAGVADRVQHVRARSDDAHGHVGDGIALLYIDGAHRYAPARQDIRQWGARVSADGTMLIHDAFAAVGVTVAIGRELLLGRRWRYVGRTRSLAEYRADLRGDVRSRATNAVHQLAQLPWFGKNLVVKLLISARLGGVVRVLTGRAPQWPY